MIKIKIGEITELLIQIKDDYLLCTEEYEALCSACNILNKLPITMDEEDAKERMKTVCEKK